MVLEWYFLRVQVGREERIRKTMIARPAGAEEKQWQTSNPATPTF